jgi:hypothetical protein
MVGIAQAHSGKGWVLAMLASKTLRVAPVPALPPLPSAAPNDSEFRVGSGECR